MNFRSTSYFTLTLTLGIFIGVVAISCRPNLPEDVELAYRQLPDELDYSLHVKPILSDKCFACHGPDQAKQKAGLRLDFAEYAYGELPENPGKFAIKPGRPSRSELFHRILSEDPDYKMPTPESHLTLSAREKAILIKWIEKGAAYKPHWSLTKIERPKIPKVKKELQQGIGNEIDLFVRAKLQQEGLQPTTMASKEILLRRLSLDLTGLPPTAEEIEKFLADDSENAWEKQVDRLLNSPHFGEKMATDWLDLARFADSHGYTVDRLRDMSPYRDWVIEAFNANMPYDRFLHLQLAGDLMENPTKEMLIATAFNRNHPQNMEGGIIEEEFQTEYVVDRVNTFGDAMLGLSLSCAKCHDHKYDPISQKEYFELFSFFNNVREAGQISWDDAMPAPTLLLPTPSQEKSIQAIKAKIQELEQSLDQTSRQSIPDFEQWLLKKNYQKLKNQPIPKTGLTAYYNFEGKNLTGSHASKTKGILKYNGSPVTSQPKFVAYEDGTALQMDGDVYLDVSPAGVFRKSDPFTIGIRIKIPEELSEGVIFHKSDFERLYNFRGYHLYLKDNKLEANLAYVAPSNALTRITVEDVPKDRWIHVTMTYDGSSRAEGLRLYIDGMPVKLQTEMDQLTKDILFGRKVEPGLQIGAWGRGLGFKNGLVDDISVYDRELTPFEIEVLAGRSSWEEIAQTDPDQLTDEQKARLQNYYMYAVSDKVNQVRLTLKEHRAVLSDTMQYVKELMVMQEYPVPKQAYVLLRGEYANKGEKVFPNTPRSILPFPDDLPRNRLGLAQWLTSKDHPLTARVAVNRYWQNMFGSGLVKTTEDFGNQGEMPSHPELLDWLAAEFMDSGWDVKQLHKRIAMSATYRQDSRATVELREKDPENRLLARGPSKRLTAEMIRDNALAAAGLLSKKIGGPSIKPYQPEGLWEINSGKYFPDTGQDVYRRSLYVLVKRTVPNPTLNSFDAPDRSYCVVRRQQTNTPLQALVTLNDPTFVEASRKMGEKMAREKEEETAIKKAYLSATGRWPSAKEIDILKQQYALEFRKMSANPEKIRGWLRAGHSPVDPSVDSIRTAAFAVVASTILNSDATLTLR